MNHVHEDPNNGSSTCAPQRWVIYFYIGTFCASHYVMKIELRPFYATVGHLNVAVSRPTMSRKMPGKGLTESCKVGARKKNTERTRIFFRAVASSRIMSPHLWFLLNSLFLCNTVGLAMANMRKNLCYHLQYELYVHPSGP